MSPAGEVAPDVTACIPTFRRLTHVLDTVRVMLVAEVIPGTVLVSEGSADSAARDELVAALADLTVPPEVTVRAIGPPPCGSRCGNRNWLAAHVQTALLMWTDDDVSVPPGFLRDALASSAGGPAVVATAADDGRGEFAWLTERGHFRTATDSDPVSVGLQLSLWPTAIFTDLWLDESIEYGYEDADASLRLYAHHGEVRVVRSEHRFIDRGRGISADHVESTTEALAERARIYVASRRCRGRGDLARLLGREVTANVLRGRRPLPVGEVPHQTRDVVRWLAGGARPVWATDAGVVVAQRATGLGG